jgi:hypothetical protein
MDFPQVLRIMTGPDRQEFPKKNGKGEKIV